MLASRGEEEAVLEGMQFELMRISLRFVCIQ